MVNTPSVKEMMAKGNNTQGEMKMPAASKEGNNVAGESNSPEDATMNDKTKEATANKVHEASTIHKAMQGNVQNMDTSGMMAENMAVQDNQEVP